MAHINMIFFVVACSIMLCVATGQPVPSPRSIMTQYLTETCDFYAKEKLSAGGCNFEDVIEDVKEFAENLEQPRQPITNWDGNLVERFLDQAEMGEKTICTGKGAHITSACAAMDAVCGLSKANLIECRDVTAAPPTLKTVLAASANTATPTVATTA